MRYIFGFGCALALSLALMAGCGEKNGEGGSGGTAGSGGQGGSGGGDVARLDIFAGIYDPALPGLGISGPAEGIEVCELDTVNCDVTGTNGYASLLLPVDQEVGVSAQGQGYGSVLESTRVPSEGLFTSLPMSSEQRLADQYERVASPYPMQETGAVFVTIYSGPNAPAVGATLELLGTTAKSFYRDEDKYYDIDLAATTSGGGGGFVEVSPGERQIEIGGTADNCEVLRGWVGDAPNRVRFAVREGHTSSLRVSCEVEP